MFSENVIEAFPELREHGRANRVAPAESRSRGDTPMGVGDDRNLSAIEVNEPTLARPILRKPRNPFLRLADPRIG